VIEHDALAGATVDTAGGIPPPDRESHGLRDMLLRDVRATEQDLPRIGIRFGSLLHAHVGLEDGPRDLGRREPLVVPPEAIEIPPPPSTVLSQQQDGSFELRRREAREPAYGATEIVALGVKTEYCRVLARGLALGISLLDAGQALLLRRQLVALCVEVRANPLDVSGERSATHSPWESTTSIRRRRVHSSEESPLQLLERHGRDLHVPLRLDYIDLRLRDSAAMLARLLAILRDVELLDECRGVLDKHRRTG